MSRCGVANVRALLITPYSIYNHAAHGAQRCCPMIVFATYNIKGGVGKTAAAVNLAYLASHCGYRTLLWDLDPQGAASFYLRGDPAVDLDLDALLDKDRGIRPAIRATDYIYLDLLPASLAYRNFDLALGDRKSVV